MKQQFLFGMSAWIFMWSFSLFLFLCSCEKPQVDTEAQPNPPKADSSYLAIEGIEVSNGQVIALGYNIVKFQGNFKKFQASSFSIVDYGYVVSFHTDQPTIDNHEGITNEGPRIGAGSFESGTSGLLENKTYYARIYLKKEFLTTGNIEYSYHPYSITFKTKPGIPPMVKNLETTIVTNSSFQVNAVIEDENQLNIIQHGHVWSKNNQIPDLVNNDGFTANGPLQSVFTHQFFSDISNASPYTQYFVRAYASNQFGTGYSPLITVSTGTCGAYIAPGEWKEFMCHNLGSANFNADPFTPSWEIHGGYWQWGRKEQAAEGPTGPGVGQTIEGNINGWNNISAPIGSWADDSKTINDPCPEGYRIPTKTQLDGLVNNLQSVEGTWENSPTNFSSGRFFGTKLFLPSTGRRDGNDGKLANHGIAGFYWTSTRQSVDYAWCLGVGNSTSGTGGWNSTYGLSIRCISE